mmetsp:Transcript_8123/g.18287  ORF Transcript_8123/g.18287 Transcript_8123/m.18287 type:complete len:119 (-) Transcript_8123:191-547(-)
MMKNKKYMSTKFEVSGRVQGVFFRKHTKAKAEELGLTGWCRNTPHGTVEGEYEYVSEEQPSSSSSSNERREEKRHWGAEAFRHWLCNVGSPRSQIDRCSFSEMVVSNSPRFEKFRVVR